jgi:tRNA threonylcarbamoyladenosine biosynthesis protein TsaE
MRAQGSINSITRSAAETFAWGRALAQRLSPHSCLLISGPLGAGKTELIKGVCSYFGIDQDCVQSPTYALHHDYQNLVSHFDLYRLNSCDEFLERGFLDILNEDKLIVIEWPTKLPITFFEFKNPLSITIEVIDETTRKIHSHGQN